MKDNRLRKFETVKDEIPGQDTDEEFSAFITELVEIGEKLQPKPNHKDQTLKEMIYEMEHPTVIVQRHDGKRISIKDGVIKVLSDKGREVASTKTNAPNPVTAILGATTFTDSELETLENLKNS